MTNPTRRETEVPASTPITVGIAAKTGHDFSSYKKTTVLRRVDRRMVVKKEKDFTKYLSLSRKMFRKLNFSYLLCHRPRGLHSRHVDPGMHGKEGIEAKIQIFATDLDEQAVLKAQVGLYAEDIVSEVSEDRLNRLFTRNDGL